MRTSSDGAVYAQLRATAARQRLQRRIQREQCRNELDNQFILLQRLPNENLHTNGASYCNGDDELTDYRGNYMLHHEEADDSDDARFPSGSLRVEVPRRSVVPPQRSNINCKLYFKKFFILLLGVFIIILTSGLILGYIEFKVILNPSTYWNNQVVTKWSPPKTFTTTKLDPSRQYLAKLKLEKHKNKKLARHLDLLTHKHNVKRQLEDKSNKETLHEVGAPKEVLPYNANEIDLTDFALRRLGGSIKAIIQTSPYYKRRMTYSFFGFELKSLEVGPDTLIQERQTPGNCYTFVGDTANIRLKLAEVIYIKSVTLDHLQYDSIDPGATPKGFSISGVDRNGLLVRLGKFMYDLNGKQSQTFTVQNDNNYPFRVVELRIFSNYGNSEFTCLYRFRVHGKRVFFP